MSILAVVLGTAYATTTRSFHSGLNAQARDQALLIAQQQIELLKNADSGPNPTISNYQRPLFCINPTNGDRVDLSTSQPTCATPVGAPESQQSQFKLSDTYNTNNNKAFNITVQWQSAGNNQMNQVILNYKTSNSYVPPS